MHSSSRILDVPKTPGASSPMPDAFESGVTNFAGTRRTPASANRFAPGSIIAGRYRLVAMLGKGAWARSTAPRT
jgi:hypothetical protein